MYDFALGSVFRVQHRERSSAEVDTQWVPRLLEVRINEPVPTDDLSSDYLDRMCEDRPIVDAGTLASNLQEQFPQCRIL